MQKTPGRKNRKSLTGFTLIELLVVISIIGMLASVIMVSLNSSRLKSKIAKARADIGTFIKVVQVAQGESGKTLIQITGSGCSACGVCWGAGDLRNTSGGCYTNWLNVLNTVQTSAGGVGTGIDKMLRDPWGSPYVVDENEKEFGPNDCRLDNVASPGPDGISGNGDDIYSDIPLSNICL